MNNKVADLSQRLQNAIDPNYNVTNLDEFLAVIEALEGTTVTKELLETTRMAKHINEVRRRTRIVPLARRVKLLLKKWRNIVLPAGSDNSSSNVVAMSNENVASANFKQQQRYPLSQSTSPIGAMTFSSNSAPSTVTSATRSANLNVHNYNMKRLENVEVPIRACSSTSTVPKDCGKQPTSFANLIPDLNRNKSISTTETNCARINARRKTSTLDKSDVHKRYDIANRVDKISGAMEGPEPIVIDIQDSNSDSDVISPAEPFTNSNSVAQPSPLSSKKSIGASIKPKKTKKEKKRKDRESQNDKSPLLMHHFNNSAVADAISQPLIHPIHITADDDIFSISNSSINSMFAGESIPKVSSNDTLKSKRPLPKPITTAAPADLSFAGKFQPQRNSSVAVPTGFGNSIEFLSGTDNDRSLPCTTKVDFGILKPASENVVNSNDSSSCSRASQFEPGVIVDEVRLQQLGASSASRIPVPRADLAANVPTLPSASVASVIPAAVPSEADALSSSTKAANPEQKIPKKRGRKKGSKGVDSVIAKEASLSSQMLISSLGAGAKKVKTTKELYAEMQNRKFGINHPNVTQTNAWGGAPTQLPSHTETSCSDSSDAFAKNTAPTTLNNGPTSILLTAIDESSSDSSRPSIASGKRARAISVESNSNSELASSKARSLEAAPTQPEAVNAIDQQLQEFIKDLPPPPSLREIELECTADLVPCTCTITEMLPEELVEDLTATDEVENAETKTTIEASKADTTTSEIEQLPQIKNKTNLEEPTEAEPPRPHLRSIFDLDYDEEDDPLNTLYADVYSGAAEQKTELETSSSDGKVAAQIERREAEDEDKHSQNVPQTAIPTENTTSAAPVPVPVSEVLPFPFPTFKVEEDPECVAKARFELQTQKITEFHIKALHNCYIPNINGNWDHTNETNTNLLTADRSASARNFVNVVPKYGYGMFEDDYIPKDLSKVSFTKNFKPKKRTAEMDALMDMPFLGAARLPFIQKSRVKRKHKHKKMLGSEGEDRTSSLSLLKENEKTVEAVMESKDNPDAENPPNSCAESFITSNTVNSYLNNELNADADTAGLNNNNNELLKDISIDIADTMANYQYMSGDGNVGALRSASPQSQNLLTTVDKHPYQVEVMATENASTNNGEEFGQAIAVNSSATEGEMDDNASSRYSISSHCSKSSLKDIQHSINLKLRRRTTNSNERKRQKHSRNKSEVDSDDEPPPKKRSRIKRIKIAINGDIATQRQISIGSSNNSSDYGNSDEDNASDNSNASRSSTFEDNQLYTVIDDGQDAGEDDNDEEGSDNNADDDEYGELEDTDVDGDADGEDDEEEDYTGEYHEVVTRDISAPSTNNNHIVLTIKKTPSKTNSPSNSVSAISPILASVKKSTAANEKLTVSPKESSQSASETESALETDSVAVVAPSPVTLSPAHKHEHSLKEEEQQLINNKETKNIAKSKSIELSSASESDSFRYFLDAIAPDRRRYRTRRLRRRRKPIQPFRFPDDDPTPCSPTRLLKRKTHRHLFFDDELNVRVDHNLRDKLLNISSCSSSCGDRSEYEPFTSEDEKTCNSLEKVKNVQVPVSSLPSPPIKSPASSKSSCDSDDEEAASIDPNSQNEETPTVRNSDQEPDSPDDELPAENNGLLMSFNHIYQTSDQLKAYEDNDSNGPDQELKALDRRQEQNDSKQAKQQHEPLKQQLPNENCDDYNNPYNNNNNFNLIKFDKSSLELNYMYKNGRNQQLETEMNAETQIDQVFSTTSKQQARPSSSTDLAPHKEYQTGLRAVDEDVHDEQGNNCARVQQFKEWHQMLRLRSYNDDLLTVLPYVVLDF